MRSGVGSRTMGVQRAVFLPCPGSSERQAMRLELDVQNVSAITDGPQDAEIRRWVEAALADVHRDEVALTVRIVDEPESAALNRRYRHQEGATNVLSFPFENPPGVETDILGDVVICAPLVMREARAQCIPPSAHWALIVVHGVLHLRGYDHRRDDDARVMENREARILTELGFDDPLA